MAQVTKDMCEHIIAAADRGERFPLTVNEMRQLAWLAIKGTASAATVAEPSAYEHVAGPCVPEIDRVLAAQQQADPESVIKRQAQMIAELIADRDSWIEAHARLYRLYHEKAAQQQTNQGASHEWDATGERCLKCGDKDWFAGSTCSEKAAQQQADAWVEKHGFKPFEFKDAPPEAAQVVDQHFWELTGEQQAKPGADEPPLGGRWHHGNGVVVCGTLRIFGEDFDTDPAQDFKESILTWVCDTLNAAQDAYRAAHYSQQSVPGVDDLNAALKLHGLPRNAPSQLADAFRLGAKWAAQSGQRAGEEVRRLREENFKLAAGQCVHKKGIIGDEGGTPLCPITLTSNAEGQRLFVPSHTADAVVAAIEPWLKSDLDADQTQSLCEAIQRSVADVMGGQRAGVPENDPYCPRCKGHGEETAMSNNGPDAEELTIACQHCGGEGSLSEAYKGVAKLLAEEQKKYLDACGKLWFARHGDVGQRAGVAEDAKSLPFAVLDALRFYANGSHFCLADETAWDTVSGEPQNFWCDEAGTATVEDGSIAKAVLQGVAFTDGDNSAAVDGEVYTAQEIAAAPTQQQEGGI